MEIYSFLKLLFLLVSYETTAQEPLCTPGEEQRPHNITLGCTGETVFWFKDNSQIAVCDGNKCQAAPGFSGYNGYISSSASTLIIKSVTRRSSGTYSCRSGPQNVSCDFKVYARPTSVSGQQAVFQADTVTVVCTVTRIFPNPFCKFKWTINSTESHSLQEQLIKIDAFEYGDPVYYNAICSFKLPARNFSVGSYQFQVRAYPNVTGKDSDSAYGVDSSWTSPQSVVYPVVKLECPDTNPYAEEGKSFSCACRETANNFILATTTLSYGSTRVNSTQNITASFTANRTKGEITCETQLADGTNVRMHKTIQVAFGPSIFSFKANNNTEQIIIDRNSGVSFSCQAEGNPSLRLSLRKNGTELQLLNESSYKFNLTLSYSNPRTECLDTGVYMCLAEAGRRTTSKTLAVYVKCKPQFRDSENLNKIHLTRVNGTVWINVTIFGHPEPNMTLISNNYSLFSKDYNLTYIKLEPPYGNVSLTINIKNEQFFQNYTLNINNNEGPLTYSFEIIEGDPASLKSKEGPELNVGAVVGGVIAGVLVIAVVAVLLFILLKRRGHFPNRDNEGKNADRMLNFRQTDTNEDSPTAQVIENSPYEEIVDLQSDMPDRPVYTKQILRDRQVSYTNQIMSDETDYTNQISNIQHKEVEYENTVCSL